MRIKKLIIRKMYPSQEIVREIDFLPKGLNLIVDNTTAEVEDSGNSVGKTTAIKVIDLCLGAKSVREIYYDPDTRTENVEIRDFLKDNKIQAELTVFSQKSTTILTRELFPKGGRYFNGEKLNQSEYWDKLKKLFFNVSEPNPTLRQLIPKFVRVSNTSEDKMVKFLPSMTTNDTYDTIYTFLFGLFDNDMVSLKDELNKELADCNRTLIALEKNKSISSLSALRQKEELIDKELKEYSTKRSNLSYMEEYKFELEQKRKLTTAINEIQGKLELVEFELSTIDDSINKLQEEKRNIDLDILANIYKEANMYIGHLQKSFEDVVKFHNEMIEDRINFIKEQFLGKENVRQKYVNELNQLIEKKKQITIEVLDEGLLDELNIYNNKIEELSKQKGEIENSISLLTEQEERKNDIIGKIQKIEEQMDEESIDEKLKIFNQFFSEYCNQLYGEKYLLAYDKDWKEHNKFPISIDSLSGNVGTGKKKALIVAFDLAYIKYASVMNIPSPKFVIHDKLENTHINQLKTIFSICQDIEGQYIIPILRERIDKVDSDIIDDAIVLELKEDDKFFRI